MPATPLPPEEVRGALARAAVDNANCLVADASGLLAAAGSAPTAHSLAVLALEEVGKAIICLGGFAGSDNTVTTREDFNKEINSHAAKLTWAKNFVDFMAAMTTLGLGDNSGMGSPEEYLRTLQERRKHDHVRKMRGFYVDLSASDEVELPKEITAAEAETMISLAGWTGRAVRALFVDGTSFELYRFVELPTEPSTPEENR